MNSNKNTDITKSAPIADLLRMLSPKVSQTLEAWAQQEGITTIADLGENPEDLERLEKIKGIGHAAILNIQHAWVRDDQRIARAKLTELNPIQTAASWGAILAILAITTFVGGLLFFSWKYNAGIVLVELLVIGGLLWAQRQTLKNEHVGIVQLFKKRKFSFPRMRAIFVASEGVHFAIHGILDFEVVNLLLRPDSVSAVKGWSKNGDPIIVSGKVVVDDEEKEVGAVITWHVMDIIRHTSVDWEKIHAEALPTRVKEVIRAELRGLTTKQALSGRLVERQISNAVERAVNITAWEWGIAIANDGVFIPSVDVDSDVRTEMKEKAKDVRYREAMEEFFEAFENKDGLEGDELLRHFRVHRGEANETVNRNIQAVSVDENTLAGLLKLFAAWLTRSSTS